MELKYATNPKGTIADDKWWELNDLMYTAMLNPRDHKYMQCKVILEYPNADKKVSYNLPVYPEEVNNTISTNYQSTEILGRPGQISSYTSTSDPTSSFTLHMHRENRSNEVNTDLNNQKNHIDQIVALIEAAQYPYMDIITLVMLEQGREHDSAPRGIVVISSSEYVHPVHKEIIS